jgi:hypothetical protein
VVTGWAARRPTTAIGISIVLIALGAILVWAVNASVSGVELTTIGVILLVAGTISALVSFMFWSAGGTRWRPSGEGGDDMPLGISIATLALGAALIWGTSATVGGVDLALVGIVLMAFSVVGLFAAVALWEPRRGRRPHQRARLDHQRGQDIARGEWCCRPRPQPSGLRRR